jgi:hypothetical protein
MKEGECHFKIIAFVNGNKLEVPCIPEETGCLKNLVWCGIGIKAAAAEILGLDYIDITDAAVEGDCKG